MVGAFPAADVDMGWVCPGRRNTTPLPGYQERAKNCQHVKVVKENQFILTGLLMDSLYPFKTEMCCMYCYYLNGQEDFVLLTRRGTLR